MQGRWSPRARAHSPNVDRPIKVSTALMRACLSSSTKAIGDRDIPFTRLGVQWAPRVAQAGVRVGPTCRLRRFPRGDLWPLDQINGPDWSASIQAVAHRAARVTILCDAVHTSGVHLHFSQNKNLPRVHRILKLIKVRHVDIYNMRARAGLRPVSSRCLTFSAGQSCAPFLGAAGLCTQWCAATWPQEIFQRIRRCHVACTLNLKKNQNGGPVSRVN